MAFYLVIFNVYIFFYIKILTVQSRQILPKHFFLNLNLENIKGSTRLAQNAGFRGMGQLCCNSNETFSHLHSAAFMTGLPLHVVFYVLCVHFKEGAFPELLFSQ